MLASINDVTSNTSKYQESLNVSAQTSTLTITGLSREDVDIPYECTYGFDSFRKILTITEKQFECKYITKFDGCTLYLTTS